MDIDSIENTLGDMLSRMSTYDPEIEKWTESLNSEHNDMNNINEQHKRHTLPRQESCENRHHPQG